MNFWKAILLTLLYITVTAPLFLIFIAVKHLFTFENEKYEYFLHIAPDISAAIGIYGLWHFYVRKKTDFKEEKNQNLNFALLFAILLIFIGIYFSERPFINFYNDFIIKKTYHHTIWTWEEISQPFIIAQLISALIIAPIFEEIFFRKFIFSKLLQKNSLLSALLISSLCFSLIHLPNYRQMITTFYWGIIVAYIFYRTKNLIYPIIFHFLWNLNHYFLKFFGKNYYDYMEGIKYETLFWGITFLGIISLLFGIYILQEKTENQKKYYSTKEIFKENPPENL